MRFTRKRLIFITLILSTFILSSFAPIYAFVNGVQINTLANVNTDVPVTCWDGTFYYVFWSDNNILHYAYSPHPNVTSTWITQTIHTGDANLITFSVNCGYGGRATYVIYSQFTFTNFTANVRYNSILAGNIGASTIAFTETESGGGAQSSYLLSPQIIPYKTGFVFGINFGIASCNSGNLYIISSKTLWSNPYVPARTNDCSAIPYRLLLINGVPTVIYSCSSSGNLCNTGVPGAPSTMLGETRFTNSAWSTVVFIASNGASTQFSVDNNATQIWTINTHGTNPSLTDYDTFNIHTLTWNPIVASKLSFSPSPPAVIKMGAITNQTIPRIYYFLTTKFYYIYPINETQANQHQLYDTLGDTIQYPSIISSAPGQSNNGWLASYTVSSTNPHTIKFSTNVNDTFSVSMTITKTRFVTNTISPALSKCTDTNSCTTNQTSQFFVILLPSIIIIALLEYFPYKMGVKDERVYIMIFMFIVSGIGFLSSQGAFGNNGIPFYIPIFCDIVGFMLILTYSRSNSSGGF